MSWWYRTMHPSVYQGIGKKAPYFEGWYFKMVSEENGHALAFIPGVSLGEDSHSFLQIIDGVACTSRYVRYSLHDFKASSRRLDIQLGRNRFTADRIIVEEEGLHGEVEILDSVPWKSTLLRPGIMGWYSYVPFMQCYHGLVSANHRIRGSFNLHEKIMHFNDGMGYTEKDWGKSFPRSWIWTQCNTFDDDLSIMASVAHIPWLHTHFIGFLAVVWHRGALEVFTTYTGAQYEAKLDQDKVILGFSNRHSSLHLVITQAEGADLRSPISGDMRGKVNESLMAEMEVTYKVNEAIKASTMGTRSGLEVAGDVAELLTH